MSTIKKLCIATAVAGAMAFGATAPATAEIDEKKFTVVGTWHFLANWKHHEKRLWETVLPEASGGKITANARPLTELGMKGFELMRQLKVGVFVAVTELATKGTPVTLFLVQNGVLAVRQGARVGGLAEAAASSGVTVMADTFALQERGIAPGTLTAGVQTADVDTLVDLLMADGQKAIWH